MAEEVRAWSDKPNVINSTRELRKIEATLSRLSQELAAPRQMGKRSPSVNLQDLFFWGSLPYCYQHVILQLLNKHEKMKKDDEEPSMNLQDLSGWGSLPYHYQHAILQLLNTLQTNYSIKINSMQLLNKHAKMKEDDEEPSMLAEADKLGTPKQWMYGRATRGFDNEDYVKEAAQQRIPQSMRRSNGGGVASSILLRVARRPPTYCVGNPSSCFRK